MTRSKSGYIATNPRPSCPTCGYQMKALLVRASEQSFNKPTKFEKVGWYCKHCKTGALHEELI